MGCGAATGKKYDAKATVTPPPVGVETPDSAAASKTPGSTANAVPAEGPAAVADAAPPMDLATPTTSMDPATLRELLETASLGQFEATAKQKVVDDVITDLGDLMKREEVFSASLGLKPLERKRLRKALGRSGDSVPLLPLLSIARPNDKKEQQPEQENTDPLPEGLGEILIEAKLAHLRANASSWCKETGAVSLNEVREHADHFTNFLCLLPEELERLRAALRVASPRQQGEMVRVPSRSEMVRTVTVCSTHSEACLIELFETFDVEGKGLVKPEVLLHWMTSLGGTFTDKECKDMMQYATPDSDGLVDYVKFIQAVMVQPDSPMGKYATMRASSGVALLSEEKMALLSEEKMAGVSGVQQ